ncbi:acyl-CoA/acyl-ACP dehydrogenase [Natronomonas halophila]|uniref:acyl-CoA dehydrogenase family protein n=1 Tax=Natronomonas halophila TaxID=2747817 RepID=UPI0015B748C2|nr:acyl-CoA dehydrogenase family protein [Natronomonas halophila]QLD84212.1 acyl-CoA/acyl-ACP dehydrogenase [Natronomonas halophila]
MAQSGAAFGEGEELKLIEDTAARIASDYDDDYWQRVNHDQEEPAEFWQDCADAGFLGATVPEEYGGEGMGLQELTAIVRTLEEYGAMGAGMLFVVTPVFGAITLSKNGSEAQKEEYLPKLANGEMNFCMALTEPGAGHNTPNLDTTAEEDGDGFVINGSKQWISGVGRADKMLLVARTTPREDVERRTEGITLFLADPDSPGVEYRELNTGIPAPERQFEINFDDYRLDSDAIIGERGKGLYQLFETVNPERLVGAAGVVGAGKCALNRAIDYAKEREVFDAPIGSHQAIQHPIADKWSRLEAAELMLKKAAWEVDAENRDAGAAANMTKLRASEAGYDACDFAVQVHGGNGLSEDYFVVDLWKQARLSRIAPGSSEMMRNYIGESVLGLPRSY